jgi:ABC-2 type transport system ATP-binding protein
VASQPPAISLRGLTKRYGRLVAVRDLSLDVQPGEVFGFLGLNGAGKTTTIRVLLDLLRPTSGQASIFGFDCRQRGLAARALVGYLPGEIGFYPDMTGERVLTLLGRLSSQPVDPAFRQHLLDRMALRPQDLRRRLREYSTGMKRKLGIVQAFQADPPLLVLDEPTEGLDPLMQERFYQLLFDVRAKGRTVFVSSHVLSEVEHVCDRIAVIRAGELALLTAVDELRRLAPRRVSVSFEADVAPPALPSEAFELIEARPRRWTLRAHGPIGALVRLTASLPVSDIEVQEPRLEDVLLKYYGEGTS